MKNIIIESLHKSLSKTAADFGTYQIVEASDLPKTSNPGKAEIEITHETTQDAALRFRKDRVTVLNFASVNYPGGGVRHGAKAQEEALCACSGLLHGLENCMSLYKENNAPSAPKEGYDRMIYSEDVPLVLNGKFQSVPTMRINVITYSAPNCQRKQFTLKEGKDIFDRRIRQVLRKADSEGTEILILGAWGCGAYGNNPNIVAKAFQEAILEGTGNIQKIVFAIYGVPENQQAFEKTFSGV